MLREFVAGDRAALARIASDPAVLKQVPPDSRALAAAARAGAGARPGRARRAYHLAIVVRRSGKLIGACDLTLVRPREADIGYLLARRHWGYGYGAEVAKILVEQSFTSLGLRRISAVVAIDNDRSRRVLEKAGLHWQGLMRRHARAAGRWRDCHLYVLARADWQARSA